MLAQVGAGQTVGVPNQLASLPRLANDPQEVAVWNRCSGHGNREHLLAELLVTLDYSGLNLDRLVEGESAKGEVEAQEATEGAFWIRWLTIISYCCSVTVQLP